jgi:rhodanese-related sulfurtransferase
MPCHTGRRHAHGIDNIHHLEGSFYAWIKGKYPVEKGEVKKEKGW